MKKVALSLSIFALALLSLSLVYYLEAPITGFAIYQQNTATEFNEGSYNNTEYNSSVSGIKLQSDKTSGTYTSKIFNASSTASWNNISYSSNEFGEIKNNPDTSLLMHFNNNWQDSSDNNHEITNSEASFTTNSKLGTHASQFTSTTDHINITHSNSISLNDSYSIEMWIYIPSGAQSWEIEWKKFLEKYNQLYFQIISGYKVRAQVNGYSQVDSTSGLQSDTWNHIVLTVNNTNSGNDILKLYINGNSERTLGPLWGTPASGNSDIIVGAGISSAESIKQINIDELIIYNNKILTASEISEHYQRASVNLSLKARTCDDSECSGESFQNIEDSLNLSLQENKFFQYQFLFGSESAGSSPIIYNLSIDYTNLNRAPEITLITPSNGDTYGYNNSILLNFTVSDPNNNIDSCWYILNSEKNIIPCQDTTINAKEGQNTLEIYVNDTENLEANQKINFSVVLGAPTITLNSPINSYIGNKNIDFSYTPEDIDLDSCELWGDFTGNFSKNQTETSPENNAINTFSLYLEDRIYKWNVKCNDSVGNSAFNGNQTFTIDTQNPEINLTSPSGTYTSKTTIPLNFTSYDISPKKCYYNITYKTTNANAIPNTEIINCEVTTFSVPSEAEYKINLWITDSVNHTTITNSTFTISESTTSTPASSGSSGGGGSGGGGGYIITSTENKTKTHQIQITDLQDIIIYPGEQKTTAIEIKNTGNTGLNKCKIISNPNYSEWIKTESRNNINIDEIIEYLVDLKIPETATSNSTPKLYLECLEKTIKIPLKIIVIEKSITAKITNMELQDKELIIDYEIKSNTNQSDYELKIIDESGNIISQENIKIQPSKITIKNRATLNIENAEPGMLQISLTTSEKSEPLTQEQFVYNRNTATGFALLDLNPTYTYIGIISLFFLIVAGLIIFRIIKEKNIKNKTKSKKTKKKK